MRVLVTGANGQLGYDVLKLLESQDIDCLGTDRTELDITNQEQVIRVITDYHPDVVIHCAAYTAVDNAEDEQELCYQINVLGTRIHCGSLSKHRGKNGVHQHRLCV